MEFEDSSLRWQDRAMFPLLVEIRSIHIVSLYDQLPVLPVVLKCDIPASKSHVPFHSMLACTMTNW
jgi:hypothetical protein